MKSTSNKRIMQRTSAERLSIALKPESCLSQWHARRKRWPRIPNLHHMLEGPAANSLHNVRCRPDVYNTSVTFLLLQKGLGRRREIADASSMPRLRQ